MNYRDHVRANYHAMIKWVADGHHERDYFKQWGYEPHIVNVRRWFSLAYDLALINRPKGIIPQWKPEPCSYKDLLIPAQTNKIEVIIQSKMNK
jgi:hypothetical protein